MLKRLSLLLVLMSALCARNLNILGDLPHYNGKGYDNCNHLTNGEFALLKSFLEPGDVVFDVGANVGCYSREVFKTEPSATIYAFEPIPAVFAKLQNLKRPNFHPFNVAVSDSNSSANFFSYKGKASELSGLYKRPCLKKLIHQDPSVIEVVQIRLADFCDVSGIDTIDLLKIDTEGAELSVLKGARPLLEEGRITAIQFEYGGCYLDAKTTLHEAITLLTEENYLVFRVLSSGLVPISKWHPSLECYKYSNYFAIRRDRFPNLKLVDTSSGKS